MPRYSEVAKRIAEFIEWRSKIIMAKSITEHEGNKYLRRIHDATDYSRSIQVDVYAVLEAFLVTCPARQHAIKKLLCAGIRGKGDELADLIGVDAAVSRAIDIQRGKDEDQKIGG